MAVDAQIDTLRIDIETRITSDTDKIDKIYESLKRLKSITEEKWSGLDEVVSKINKLGAINQTAFAGFNQSIQTVSNSITNLQQVTATPLQTEQGRLLKELELVQTEINALATNYQNLLSTFKTPQRLELARATGELAEFEKPLIRLYRQYNNLTNKLSKFNEETKVQPTITKQTENLGKSAEKASFGWDKLLLSIKRIAFYRIVRRAIQLIGKEITNSIKNFVMFDDQTNEAISGLMTSWKTMANSFAVVFSQLINTAAPVLIYILRLATDIANAISLIFATLSGEEYYSKAIEYEINYREELEKTNKMLLGFDRFNVLQQQTPDVSEMFKTEKVATGWAEMSNSTLALISAIETLIALKLTTWAIEGFNAMMVLVKGMASAELATKALTIAQGLLRTVGIFLIIYAIMQLVTKWDELSTVMKVVYFALIALGVTFVVFSNKTILTTFVKAMTTAKLSVLGTTKSITAMQFATAALAGAIVYLALDTWFSSMDSDSRKFAGTAAIIIGIIMAITAAVLAMNSTISWGTALLPLLAGVGAAIAGVKALTPRVDAFAQGGIPNTQGGSLFLMNEYGNPELIHENSRGQVEISNQESLTNSSYQGTLMALRQHDMETQGRGQTVDVNVGFDVNGNALARSLNPYLKQETIRIGNR